MMNVPSTQKRCSCRSSALMKGLICAAGVYIGWFIFLIQTFDSIADLHSQAPWRRPLHTDWAKITPDLNSANTQQSLTNGIQNIQAENDDVIEHVEHDIATINRDEQYKVKHEHMPKQNTEDVAHDTNNENVNLQNNEFSAKCLGDNIESVKCVQLSDFTFDKTKAERAIQAYEKENKQRIKPLRAYLEEALKDEIPNSGREPEWSNRKDEGVPVKYVEPLPLRTKSTAAPDKLTKFEYPKVDSCQDLQVKFPTDAGLLYNDDGKFTYPNVANHNPNVDVMEYAKYCPVDADPFLPWIHDVFPSNDGTKVHFVAQQKRRCNTGRAFQKVLLHLVPQVSIMQPVSVVRVDNEKAKHMAPNLWIPESDKDGGIDDELGLPRYRLSSTGEATEGDGDFTRFICRFHTLEYDEKTNSAKEVIVGETLSTYPANYEYVNYRKRKSSMYTGRGKDNGLFWLSNLRFDCPVPNNGNIQQSIGRGESVLNGTPSFYVDVIPIRTSPRIGFHNSMFTEKMVGGNFEKMQIPMSPPFDYILVNYTSYGFNATKAYGDNNVIPRVEASGRWENIPICAPPLPPPLKENTASKAIAPPVENSSQNPEKKLHTLSACLWASATFHTRGNDRQVTDTMDRMKEWLEYHLMVGFDHVYVFDNTGAHTNHTNLKEVLDHFSPTEVTRIDWPSICCNNNKPGDENTGERSSQYAAESSCRQRFGQYTEWIANIDTDEYLVPMGKYKDMREVVDAAAEEGTNILSFRSTRAYPNYDLMEEYYNGGECGRDGNPLCLRKRENATFLETYNCDFTPLPKPKWADRAKKQIYRPSYVMSHFVHYSTITSDIVLLHSEAKAMKKPWTHFFFERQKSERYTDEMEEAVMVHTKTTVPGNTKGYGKTCKFGFVETWKEKCRVGFPIPNNKLDVNASRPDGYKYNCYTNERLTNVFIPKLKEAMSKRFKH